VTNAPLWESGALPTNYRTDEPLSCNPAQPPPARKTAPFGPWSPDVRDSTERVAQFRSLAALSAAFLGSNHEIVGAVTWPRGARS